MRLLLLTTASGDVAINANAVVSLEPVDEGQATILTMSNFEQHTVKVPFLTMLEVLSGHLGEITEEAEASQAELIH
jgi:hypothetical protein